MPWPPGQHKRRARLPFLESTMSAVPTTPNDTDGGLPMLIKLQGTPNTTYQAQSQQYTANSAGIITISSQPIPDGDVIALKRQGVTVVSDDGRPNAVNSWQPPDE